VRLADLVAAVVVAALAEVGLAAVHRARRALRPGGATGTRARALHRARGRRRRRRRLLRPVRRPELAKTPSLRSTEHSARLGAPRGAAAGEGAAAVVAMPDAAAAAAAVAAMGGGGGTAASCPSWSCVRVSFTVRTVVSRPVCWVPPSLSSYRPALPRGGWQRARQAPRGVIARAPPRTEANKSSTGAGQMPQISRELS